MNGKLWIEVWEEFMAWELNCDWFDLSGRDIIAMIIGFMICLVICGMCDGKEVKFGNRNRNANKHIRKHK